MKIAVIAHDGKKAEMVKFLMDQIDLFKRKDIDIIATGNTGQHAKNAGLEVECLKSGPLGGDAQIAARVAEGEVQLVLFFRDPLDKHPHEPDINMLMRVCDVYDVALCTNPASARMVFKGMLSDL
ncbi:methylglyoxal synthase [Halocola ammonii]